MPKWKKDETEFTVSVNENINNIRINLPRQLWEDDLNKTDMVTIKKEKNGKITISEKQ